MLIQCPLCKSRTKVAGIVAFTCTTCGKRFGKPVPRKAKNSGIFMLCGIMAVIAGVMSMRMDMNVTKQLAPLLFLFGGGAFLTGIFQRLSADKSDMVVDEIEGKYAIKTHSVIVLDGIEELERAVEMEPQSAQAHFELGTAHFERKSYSAALEAYQKALALNPNHGEAIIRTAAIYSNLEKHSEAISLYQQALKLGIIQPNVHYNLGVACFRAERYEEAIVAYQEALRLEPEADEVRANLGNAYLRLGNREGALAQQKILEQNGSPWADALLGKIRNPD